MKYLLAIFTILFTNGCEEFSKTEEESGPLPIETNGEIVQQLISSECSNIDRVWYELQSHTSSYFADIKGFVKYWDTRYTLDQSASICSSNQQHSTVIDTRTSVAEVHFGGPQATMIHRFQDEHYPWRNNGNLMMQVKFIDTLYQNFSDNIGGTISFNLFLRNIVNGERINYVIAIHAFGLAWTEEQPEVLFDDSTNTSFVGSIVKPGTKYTTMSDTSNILNTKQGFFRANISTQNLYNALESQGLVNIDLNNWYIDFIGIQFEVEEDGGGDALLSGSFEGFNAYITTDPM